MHVLVAVDKFKSTLTAREVAAAISGGLAAAGVTSRAAHRARVGWLGQHRWRRRDARRTRTSRSPAGSSTLRSPAARLAPSTQRSRSWSVAAGRVRGRKAHLQRVGKTVCTSRRRRRQGRRSRHLLRQVFQVEEAPPELGRFPQHVPLRKRTNSRSDAGRIESVTYSGGAGSSGWTTPLKMNPAEMFRRDGNSSVFPSVRGKHVVAAPLQHLGCSRLTIRAHFNLRCLLLPALIGLLIDVGHA